MKEIGIGNVNFPEEMQLLFNHDQQFNRLFLNTYYDARKMERCFNIYVLPLGMEIDFMVNEDYRKKYNGDVVKVLDKSGWLYKGKWQDDFYNIVKKAKEDKKLFEKNLEIERVKEINLKSEKQKRLLLDY